MPIAALSARLATLQSLIANEYEHIWDCCCDHGKLGFSLLAKASAPYIHFVDIVPELIDNIETQLASEPPLGSQGITHCLDAAQLPLQDYAGRHLVILAGIGGELTRQILTRLHATYPKLAIDYLLCPIRQLYTLRRELNEQNFALKAERLVEDKGRFYEVILITKTRGKEHPFVTVSTVGEQIWTPTTPQEKATAKAYLEQLITHYTRMQHSQKPEVDVILQAYRQVSLNEDGERGERSRQHN